MARLAWRGISGWPRAGEGTLASEQ
jgi:hypothetical protein